MTEVSAATVAAILWDMSVQQINSGSGLRLGNTHPSCVKPQDSVLRGQDLHC